MVILNKRNLLKTREYLYTQSMLQGELVDTLGNIIEIKCMGMDQPVGANLQESYTGLITKFDQKPDELLYFNSQPDISSGHLLDWQFWNL